MSKYVKQLITDDLKRKLAGVNDALLVNVIGLNTSKTYNLRKLLREKNISLLVVKNSLARRATEGTSLSPAFEGIEGTLAIVWGASDFVALAKEITEIEKDPAYEKFSTCGGVMDKERLTPDRVKEISKWPSRTEQLSLLLGQILSPGASLLSQITSPGGKLLSQIKKKSEEEESK